MTLDETFQRRSRKMQTYKDRTYCASPNCKNICGRKMKKWEEYESKRLEVPVCYTNFCDENGELITP